MFEDKKKAAAKTSAKKETVKEPDFLDDMKAAGDEGKAEGEQHQEQQGPEAPEVDEAEQQAPEVDEAELQAPEAVHNASQLWAKIDGSDADEWQEETGAYLKLSDFAPGESRTYIATGTTKFPNATTGEMINAVKLQDRTGKNFICGASVVYHSLNDLTFPRPCKITSNGKKKGAKGEYYDVIVKVL